jgi:anti-sigma factor RsiW
MKNPREIEQLSSYLDGQLNPSDSARLESRIAVDLELASVLNDLRAARGILRKMPTRKAPRNFTLTRKMVGLKPPLPSSYSFFRFATAIATFLLFLTFAANLLPGGGFGAAAPVQSSAFCNGCGGGGLAATEAPAATQAPAVEAPALEMAPDSIEPQPSANSDATRIGEAPTADAPLPKIPTGESGIPQDQPQDKAEPESVIPGAWQLILLVIGLVSAVTSFLILQNAKKKWS